MHRRDLLAGVSAPLFIGASGCIGAHSCEEGDAGEPINLEEFPGTDTPAHNVERSGGDEDRLGECMNREPSRSFEYETGVDLAESAMLEHPSTRWVQWAWSREEAEELWPQSRTPLGDVDYDQTTVIVVQSGPHSGSRTHQWVRVENIADGLHVHGYQLDPENAQADAGGTESVITVDYDGQPEDTVIVSYTISRETREHFTTENGAVEL